MAILVSVICGLRTSAVGIMNAADLGVLDRGPLNLRRPESEGVPNPTP